LGAVNKMFIKKFIPKSLKQALKKKLNNFIRDFKSPKMLWGYDNNGVWLDKTRISDTVFMYHKERINLGNNVYIGHYTMLDGVGGLEIGEGTHISGCGAGIFTHSSHLAIRLYGPEYTKVPEDKKIAYKIEKVTIGKYVFIAAGAKILPGVTIGDGSVISANSVVKKDIPPYSLAKGDPAEVVGSTSELDQKYLNEEIIKSYYKNFI